jgi:hypothetical protein
MYLILSFRESWLTSFVFDCIGISAMVDWSWYERRSREQIYKD